MAIILIFYPDFHSKRKKLGELGGEENRLLSISHHTKAILCYFKWFSLYLRATKKKIKKKI